MNILYLNNVMEFGGVEKCIIQLSKSFKEKNKVIVATEEGPLVKELSMVGVRHYDILNTDSKTPHIIIRNIIKIANIIKREKIDIVHSHHRMTTLYCKILLKFIDFKLIHTQHLCIEDKLILTKITLKNIPIITVSNGAKENLVNKYGLKCENITTIYNTIETENEDYSIDDRLIDLNNQGRFIVAHISRLVEYKGIYDFLEVVKEVSQKEDNIRFVIIGDGEEKDRIIRYIKQNDLSEIVYLLGNKNNIINYLKKIDLVLLCSYIEGLPLVPIESFSQGVPVIATNISGTNEEIEDNVNGYLVEKKDIGDFTNKILQLYYNKDLYEKVSIRCKEVFMEKFNKDNYITNHSNVYEDVLKNG